MAEEKCEHGKDHCRHYYNPPPQGQIGGDPGDGLPIWGVCCECGKANPLPAKEIK